MLKSKSLKVRSIILACSLLAAGSSLFIVLTHSAFADGGTLVAQSQLRRTVDPAPRGPTGTLVLNAHGSIEFVSITVKGLNLTSVGCAQSFLNFYDGSNTFINLVEPLDRTSPKQGDWFRAFVGTNAAPPDFLPYADTISGLVSQQLDIITAPPTTNIVGATTNIVGGVTNIVGGVTNFESTVTNIVGGVTNVIGGTLVTVAGYTNLYFSDYLWAPIPLVVANPARLSFSVSTNLSLPDMIPIPSPNGKAKVSLKFIGSLGRSIFQVQASGLERGQQYNVWIADSIPETNFVDAGSMTSNTGSVGGSAVAFIRDTQFADPLPQQLPNASDLSGRDIQIRDQFNFINMEGVIPAP